MRTDLQLLQSATCCSDLKKADIEKIDHKDAKFINLYSVVLPEKFKGLPSKWFFGVLGEAKSNEENSEEILDELDKLIRFFIKERLTPVVFISDDLNIRFADEVSFKDQPVFVLDKFELPGKDDYSKSAKEAPILRSARKKFKNSEASYYLSPYLPNMPVNGWRFFGRKKETKEIVESQSNCFVIGARRIGKTSLLQEVRQQLEDNGDMVYWIEAQHMEKIQQLMDQIAQQLSYRDYHQVQQAGKSVDFSFLTAVIRRLKRDHKSIVLFFDEIGNVISKNIGTDSWRFIGALRELSHNNEVRIIASAFQEVILRQLANSEGPFVNFGSTVKIYSFSKSEIEELLINPLSFWANVRDKKELGKKIKVYFGSHPLILQFLGKKLFELSIKNEENFIDDILDKIIDEEDLDNFDSPIDDIFDKAGTFFERYIFLRFCIDIVKADKDLTATAITQETLFLILQNINIDSNYDTRTLLLDRLSLRGWLGKDQSNKMIYRIDCPIIYYYLNRYFSPIDKLAAIYFRDVKMKVLDINNL